VFRRFKEVNMPYIKRTVLFFFFLSSFFAYSCSPKPLEITELRHYPADSLEGIISKAGVQVDKGITSDGNGSLRITATRSSTVNLYETGDIDVENARLIFQAKIRSEEVEGQAYIEMLCHFPGKGDFFSRALHSPLSGSNEWRSQETPFSLRKGENPDNIRLNLVINGRGTVWIDNIRLIRGPLK
jgi:hypothetical protein